MNIEVRCSDRTGAVIANRFSNVSLWHYLGTTPDERFFHAEAEQMPEGWLKSQYPWIEEVQIFIASGGSYKGYPGQKGDIAECEFDRDLFENPSDRAVLDDYDFTALVRACRNMLRQGARPCLKLHNVPIKYSSEPKIDWFRVNSRPPDDYEVYADYLSALAQAMVDAFGMEEVGHWRWFVGTEMENPMWWQAPDETPESTLREYLKLHDWSVFALQRVLGDHCGLIGAHAMMNGDTTGALWDPEDFIAHCASGTNHATGHQGSKLDFFALSYYDRAPGYLESDEWQTNLTGDGADLPLFDDLVARTRQALDRHGFADMPIEVSEGAMLFGMDGKWLWYGLCPAGVFDATWTAWAFWRMLENKVDLWSRWALLRTSGPFRGLESAATNTLRLIDKMKDDQRLSVQTNGSEDGHLRVVASGSTDGAAIRVLVFHHAPDVTRPTPAQQVRISLAGLPFAGQATLRSWSIDKDHGDFWPQWEKDRAAHGITDDDYYRSRDQLDVLHALKDEKDRAFWRSKEKDYVTLSQMPNPETKPVEFVDGRLELTAEMPCFSVRLFELVAE